MKKPVLRVVLLATLPMFSGCDVQETAVVAPDSPEVIAEKTEISSKQAYLKAIIPRIDRSLEVGGGLARFLSIVSRDQDRSPSPLILASIRGSARKIRSSAKYLSSVKTVPIEFKEADSKLLLAASKMEATATATEDFLAYYDPEKNRGSYNRERAESLLVAVANPLEESLSLIRDGQSLLQVKAQESMKDYVK